MTASRRVHDIGGLPAGPVDTRHHPGHRWQVEVTAILHALVGAPRRVIRLDELRRAVEDLGEERYFGLGYFERQTQAVLDLLVEKRLLGGGEVERRIDDIRQRGMGQGR